MDGNKLNISKIIASLYANQKQLENVSEKKNSIHNINKASTIHRNKPNKQNVTLVRTKIKFVKGQKGASE